MRNRRNFSEEIRQDFRFLSGVQINDEHSENDHQITKNDRYGDPDRRLIRKRIHKKKSEVAGQKQEFVRERVKKFAEFGQIMGFAGDITVESVSQRSDGENSESDPAMNGSVGMIRN